MRKALLLVVLSALVPAAAARGAAHAAARCTATDLRGTFKAVPGSEGAGNISYTLRLTNASTHACAAIGVPHLQLLDAKGKKLPTDAELLHPSEATALMTLAPGKAENVTARFSPDVPGIGEQHLGPCEQTSYKLRLTFSSGGTLIVPISPATPVCEKGTMTLSHLSAAS